MLEKIMKDQEDIMKDQQDIKKDQQDIKKDQQDIKKCQEEIKAMTANVTHRKYNGASTLTDHELRVGVGVCPMGRGCIPVCS